MQVGIIGAGTVGATIAIRLHQQGYTISRVASRTISKAQALAREIEATVCSPHEVIDLCDLVMLATPDRVIEPLVEQLAGSCHSGQILVHFSGALSSEVMARARVAGARLLSMHPLQTFSSIDVALATLPGTHFTVEGDEPELGRRLVQALGGIPHIIEARNKVLYHAAACFASNYLVVLTSVASELLASCGFAAKEALPALLPLLQGTLTNLAKNGLPAALTGPIARGDSAVVIEHLRQLPDHYRHLYQQLGILAVAIAREKGSIDPKAQELLLHILTQQNEVILKEEDQ